MAIFLQNSTIMFYSKGKIRPAIAKYTLQKKKRGTYRISNNLGTDIHCLLNIFVLFSTRNIDAVTRHDVDKFFL